MKGILIATFVACTLLSTVSCFWKDDKPEKPVPRDCKWSEYRGTICVENPKGNPKYIMYQVRDKIPELNGGKRCQGSAYRQKECSETDYTAEGAFGSVFGASLTGGGGGAGTRTGSGTMARKVVSNPCSPTVYGADGKIRMMGKCVKTRRRRRNAEGLIETFEEPIEDTAAKERVKRQGPIRSTMNRDVLFLLDESGSITSSKFLLLKELVTALMSKFCGAISIANGKTHIAAMTFNFEPTIHFDFDASFIRANLIAKINAIPFNGGVTCLTKALKKAKDEMLTTTTRGARYGVAGTERMIVLLSDGCANCDASKLVDMRKQFEDKGISFVAFFVGDNDGCVKIMRDLLTGAKCYEVFRSPNWTDFQGIINYMKNRQCMSGWEFGYSCPT